MARDCRNLWLSIFRRRTQVGGLILERNNDYRISESGEADEPANFLLITSTSPRFRVLENMRPVLSQVGQVSPMLDSESGQRKFRRDTE